MYIINLMLSIICWRNQKRDFIQFSIFQTKISLKNPGAKGWIEKDHLKPFGQRSFRQDQIQKDEYDYMSWVCSETRFFQPARSYVVSQNIFAVRPSEDIFRGGSGERGRSNHYLKATKKTARKLLVSKCYRWDLFCLCFVAQK